MAQAELWLLGLPTTVPEKKWGAKLLECLGGEAEELVEHLSIEQVTAEKGWKTVLEMLDDKYKEPDRDELQRNMKEYFYGIQIKDGESYRNFMIRLETCYRNLTRHKLELPDEVRGWFLLRKLALDATSEATVLTTSSGSVAYGEIVKAVRSVFPQGKQSGKHKPAKDTFIAQDERDGEDHADPSAQSSTVQEEDEMYEMYEIMEVIAAQVQDQEEYDSEDALEAFEAYAVVKKKVNEKKISRGYRPAGSGSSGWNLQGAIRAKIETLKAKTACHRCRRLGHWKKECPLKKGEGKGHKGSKKEENPEVHFTENHDGFEVLEAAPAEETRSSTARPVHERKETRGSSRKAKDYWGVSEDQTLMERYHVKPRKGLFTPTGVTGIPVPEKSFSQESESHTFAMKVVVKRSWRTTTTLHEHRIRRWKAYGQEKPSSQWRWRVWQRSTTTMTFMRRSSECS